MIEQTLLEFNKEENTFYRIPRGYKGNALCDAQYAIIVIDNLNAYLKGVKDVLEIVSQADRDHYQMIYNLVHDYILNRANEEMKFAVSLCCPENQKKFAETLCTVNLKTEVA